jgi:hypothetical protein
MLLFLFSVTKKLPTEFICVYRDSSSYSYVNNNIALPPLINHTFVPLLIMTSIQLNPQRPLHGTERVVPNNEEDIFNQAETTSCLGDESNTEWTGAQRVAGGGGGQEELISSLLNRLI